MPTFLLITMIIGILPRIAIFMTTRRSIFSDRQCPPNRFAVVLGAGIEKDGRPTRVLRERIETAVNLLRRANVSALVLTGGNKSIYANETESMRLYAAELGVQNESILIDPDGFRSFDSCVNLLPLRSNQITLVTQQFHLPRAVWIARRLGINAIGCVAPHHIERWDDFILWQLREFIACWRALIDVFRFQLHSRKAN